MPLHALVIDDDLFNLKILNRLLVVEGVDYTAIQDPTQIASTLDSIQQIDFVFLDLEMPKIDGYNAFKLLQSKLGVDVPIIACTVHTNEMETTRNLGFAGFISKPLDIVRFPEQFNRIKNNLPVWDID